MWIRCLPLLFATALPAQGYNPDYDDTGPLSLLITYRCDAAKRPAFRSYLQEQGLARLAGWKKSGVIERYRVFFNWYVDETTWDALVMLKFRKYTDVAHWKKIEQTMPGGLPPAGLALGKPVNTVSADIVWHNTNGKADIDHSDSVYLLIPYKYLCLVKEYREYVNGYVIPQLDGWIKADVMETYDVLLNRFPTGDRWGSLLLLEYKDLQAFGLRKHTKYKVREGLVNDPVWKAWSARKRTLRKELEPIIADLLGSS
jgi:hypothetical protein